MGADKSVFQLYKSGVLQSTCGSQLDHGVLLVGYGTEDGKDYWKVKNSWGSSWGDAGYVKLLRGKGGSGECGLLKQASYPVVSQEINCVRIIRFLGFQVPSSLIASRGRFQCDLCVRTAFGTFLFE